MMRQCGECSVCCVIGGVPEIEKPAHTPCPFIKTDVCGSCSIFDKPELPLVCKTYRCSWLKGYGAEEDKPDKSGLLVTENILENQRYFTVIETKHKALFNNNIVAEISEKTKVPIIGVEYGKKPPHDTGDYVIVHDDVLHRCQRIVGKKHFDIEDSNGKFVIGVYELIKGA